MSSAFDKCAAAIDMTMPRACALRYFESFLRVRFGNLQPLRVPNRILNSWVMIILQIRVAFLSSYCTVFRCFVRVSLLVKPSNVAINVPEMNSYRWYVRLCAVLSLTRFSSRLLVASESRHYMHMHYRAEVRRFLKRPPPTFGTQTDQSKNYDK